MIRRVALGMMAVPLLGRSSWSQGQPMVGRTPEPSMQREVEPAQVPQPTLGDRREGMPEGTQGRPLLSAMAFSLEAASLATNAQHRPVRLFADLEAEEQRAMTEARQLAGLAVPDPSMLLDQHRRALGTLQSRMGAPFDRAFIDAQLEVHREMLRLQDTIATRGRGGSDAGDSPEVLLAIVAVPATRAHLAMLEGMRRTLPA